MLAMLRDLPAHIPADACVYGVKPSLIGYYADRRGVAPPRQDVDDTAFYSTLAKQGCVHFVLLALTSPTYSVPYYPEARMHDFLVPLSVAATPGAELPAAVLAEWTGEIPAGVRLSGANAAP
jgi:hypothetical protein